MRKIVVFLTELPIFQIPLQQKDPPCTENGSHLRGAHVSALTEGKKYHHSYDAQCDGKTSDRLNQPQRSNCQSNTKPRTWSEPRRAQPCKRETCNLEGETRRGVSAVGVSLERNLRTTPRGHGLMSVMWRIADLSRTYCDFRFVLQQQKWPALFDDLIGALLQKQRHVESKRLSGFEVNHELLFGRRLHRKFTRVRSAQNAIDIGNRSAKNVREVRSI